MGAVLETFRGAALGYVMGGSAGLVIGYRTALTPEEAREAAILGSIGGAAGGAMTGALNGVIDAMIGSCPGDITN